MPILLDVVIAVFSAIAALFSILSFLRTSNFQGITQAQMSQMLRQESDNFKQSSDEQARGLRKELSDSLQGFQGTTLTAFKELGEALGNQVKDFGGMLNSGIKSIDGRAEGIANKLDQSLIHMGEEASRNRDALRQAIEAKLDASAEKQAENSKTLREEMVNSFQRFSGGTTETLTQMSAQQKERLDNVTAALASLIDKLEKAQADFSKALREEMIGSFQRFSAGTSEILNQMSEQQKERLGDVKTALSALIEKQEKAQEALRQAIEGRLDAIRTENTAKLEEMRLTVDEKLQGTLEKRLGESFKLVSNQLEQVFKSMGEMQNLAIGVGDLKKVLSNVKSRGTWGEISLGNLLEQILTSEQYSTNVEIKPGSGQRVEYAICLPGVDDGDDKPLWLPIDAKFPMEEYERLVDAAERADIDATNTASRALEVCIRDAAKSISEKYIHPPHSTDFAVMFLPTEGLFAETIRRPGLASTLQQDYRVVIAGPTTLMALLNSLRMGFRSLAIQQRSSEVWRVLGAVKNEFGKYGAIMDKVQKKLQEAQNVVEEVGKRHRAIDRKLRDVQELPETEAAMLLDSALPIKADEEESSDVAREAALAD